MTDSTITQARPRPPATDRQAARRILLAKVGLDGHDRGVKVVARGLRDAGHQVIYGGIWQSPEAVAQAALDEDADWVGLSLLSGAHLTLVPKVLDALRYLGMDYVRCLLGGIVPAEDHPQLQQMGVAGVFGPGSRIESIDQMIRQTPGYDDQDLASLATRSRGGDRCALSRLLSRLQRGELLSDPPLEGPRIRSVAITGSAGVGKSTLIARLLTELGKRELSVAVLACDPQSPLTGGALLGDRIRMSSHLPDDRLLIRSLAVPSGQQGVPPYLDAMTRALDEHGFDVVLIESVGVGQGDVAVRQFADSVLVMLQPESGDAVQWEKAGLLEVADMVVIHKADLPGAARLEHELQQHLNVPGQPPTPLAVVSAIENTGLESLASFVAPGTRSACP